VVLSGTYAGQSISYYDPNVEEWQQYWVGSAGDKSRYYESESDESESRANLQFVTKSLSANGSETWSKMYYIKKDENTVLQNLEFPFL